jgi:hypothetical protein
MFDFQWFFHRQYRICVFLPTWSEQQSARLLTRGRRLPRGDHGDLHGDSYEKYVRLHANQQVMGREDDAS